MTLERQFKSFAKFGKTKAGGRNITLSQVDKWFKQADIMDDHITTADTAISFYKIKTKTMDFKCFVNFLEELASHKHKQVDELIGKLSNCGAPVANATQPLHMRSLGQRLHDTDTSNCSSSQNGTYDEEDSQQQGSERAEEVAPIQEEPMETHEEEPGVQAGDDAGYETDHANDKVCERPQSPQLPDEKKEERVTQVTEPCQMEGCEETRDTREGHPEYHDTRVSSAAN